MAHYIERLIANGENQQQDFKFAINDSRKIARSLSAFSNTDGGRLLVGVKDNGIVAGVRSEEEFYMVEAAAQLYCKPEVEFKTKEWNLEGKTVLEIIIPKSHKKPVFAQNDDKSWQVFVRVGDKNIVAADVLLKIWKSTDNQQAIQINYSEIEKILLEYLENNSQITVFKFSRISHITISQAEEIMIKFIKLKILDINVTEKYVYFKLRTPIDN